MPSPLTAADFDQEVLILFDAYVHGNLDRRGFLTKAQKYAKAGVTATGLLAALSPNFAAGEQVRKDDARIKTETVTVPSPAGNGVIKGYLARPVNAGTRKLPTILVIHENRGLNPHIEDITRRLALDGFMAFAPDALTARGGYPGDEDKARELFGALDQGKTLQDFVAAAAWVKARPDSNGRLGAVGFCWGGGMVHTLAAQLPDLAAGVPFYGNSPAREGAAAGAPRGHGRAHQRRVACLRIRAEGRGRTLHDAPVRRHATWIQQRHHAALRCRGGQARMGAHGDVLQREPAGSRLNIGALL